MTGIQDKMTLLPSNLPERSIELIRFAASGALATLYTMLPVSKINRDEAKAQGYVQGIISQAVNDRDYGILPENVEDVKRLPNIFEGKGIRPKNSYPIRIALAVARTGFDVIKGTAGDPPPEVQKEIIRGCCVALAFYLGDYSGIEMETDGLCCDLVSEAIHSALHGGNPLAELDGAMAVFREPDTGNLRTGLEEGSINHRLALCAVPAWLVAQSIIKRAFPAVHSPEGDPQLESNRPHDRRARHRHRARVAGHP